MSSGRHCWAGSFEAFIRRPVAHGTPLLPALVLCIASTACSGLRPRCEDSPPENPPASSAACVVVADGRLLTIRHRFGGKLGLPGGTARAGEPARCTAQRETWEETGLTVSAVEEIGTHAPRAPIFRCELIPGQRVRDRTTPPLHALPEVLGVYWIAPEELERASWRSPDQLEWLPAIVRSLAARAPATPHAP